MRATRSERTLIGDALPHTPPPSHCSALSTRPPGAWYPATGALTADGASLVLEATAAPGDVHATGAASGWSLWPITLLYARVGDASDAGAIMLPAFPWNISI